MSSGTGSAGRGEEIVAALAEDPDFNTPGRIRAAGPAPESRSSGPRVSALLDGFLDGGGQPLDPEPQLAGQLHTEDPAAP